MLGIDLNKDAANLLVVINGATLAAITSFGFKIMRFINRIEFKTEVLWEDYEARIEKARNTK